MKHLYLYLGVMMLLLGFVSCSDDEEKMSDFGLPVGKTVGLPVGDLGNGDWKWGVVMSTTEAGDLAFFLCTPDVQGGGYVAVLSHDVSRSGYIVYGLDKDCNVCYVSNITWSNTEGGMCRKNTWCSRSATSFG